MKQTIKIISFLLLLITPLAKVSAQSATTELKDTGWEFGFNFGGTLNFTDVDQDLGGGFGFTLGKWITRPTSTFGFGLRGRYLYTQVKGLSTDKAFGIQKNASLNGSNSTLDYTTPGYIYPNFKTTIHDFSFEGMLSLQTLRQNSGIILYGFGGIGLLGHKTKYNQKNNLGQKYDYSNIDHTAGDETIENQLEDKWDDSYETHAPGNKNTNLSFMPSLGLGIGYQFSRSFSINIETRMSYALDDKIDGHRWNDNNELTNTKERFNYFSMNFRWRIFGGTRGTSSSSEDAVVENEESEEEEDKLTDNKPQQDTPAPPKVNITVPSYNNATVNNKKLKVSAKIHNVKNEDNITFILNGRKDNTFSFYNSNNVLINRIVLIKGSNTIEIAA
ncbi:MAG: hypothetical protein ABEH43_03375 [Flavobacteriales bacterium]